MKSKLFKVYNIYIARMSYNIRSTLLYKLIFKLDVRWVENEKYNQNNVEFIVFS